MEIERRFLVSGFPEGEPMRRAMVEQGYLCVGEVEARIRKTEDADKTTYKLCFKSDGTLARKEVEFEIAEALYNELCGLLKGQMIKKDYRVYPIGNRKLEVCEVDGGTSHAYYYAEVEFESEEQARAFDSSEVPYITQEVTYDKSYNMKNYWQATRGQHGLMKERP